MIAVDQNETFHGSHIASPSPLRSATNQPSQREHNVQIQAVGKYNVTNDSCTHEKLHIEKIPTADDTLQDNYSIESIPFEKAALSAPVSEEPLINDETISPIQDQLSAPISEIESVHIETTGTSCVQKESISTSNLGDEIDSADDALMFNAYEVNIKRLSKSCPAFSTNH